MHRLSWALAALAVTGLAVTVTLRDAVPPLDLLYYAVPPPVAAGLLFLAAFLFGIRRSRFAWIPFALGVAAGVWWVPRQFADEECLESPDGIRVVFWNVDRGHAGWDRIRAALAEQDADLIGLVEGGGPHKPDPLSYWRRAFPGYDVTVPGHGLVVLARGAIRDATLHRLGSGSYCAEATVELAKGTVQLLLVDLEASLLASRRARLAGVQRTALARADRPVLVLGDFNTPAHSTGFDALRTHFTNLWETRGNGWSPTWPEPAPILTLDQIWVSPAVRSLCARRRVTGLSDHSLLVGEVAVE